MFQNPTREELHTSRIVVNSRNKDIGNNEAYAINLSQPFAGINEISIKSFTGELVAYTVPTDVEVIIYSSELQSGDPVVSWSTTIFAGNYSVQQLIDLLNANPSVRFEYNNNSKKIIIYRIVNQNDSAYLFGDSPFLFNILGFPQTFLVPGGYFNANWMLAPVVYSIASVDPVVLTSYPDSILIQILDLPSTVTTTGNLAGQFHIPVSPIPTQEQGLFRIYWNENTGHSQILHCNSVRLQNLGIRISTVISHPYMVMGNHVMELEIKWKIYIVFII